MDVPTETRIFWGVTNSDLSTVLLHQKLRTNSKHHGSKKLKKRHVRTTRGHTGAAGRGHYTVIRLTKHIKGAV